MSFNTGISTPTTLSTCLRTPSCDCPLFHSRSLLKKYGTKTYSGSQQPGPQVHAPELVKKRSRERVTRRQILPKVQKAIESSAEAAQTTSSVTADFSKDFENAGENEKNNHMEIKTALPSAPEITTPIPPEPELTTAISPEPELTTAIPPESELNQLCAPTDQYVNHQLDKMDVDPSPTLRLSANKGEDEESSFALPVDGYKLLPILEALYYEDIEDNYRHREDPLRNPNNVDTISEPGTEIVIYDSEDEFSQLPATRPGQKDIAYRDLERQIPDLKCKQKLKQFSNFQQF